MSIFFYTKSADSHYPNLIRPAIKLQSARTKQLEPFVATQIMKNDGQISAGE